MAITSIGARSSGVIGAVTFSSTLTQTPGTIVAVGRQLVTFVSNRQGAEVLSISDAVGNAWRFVARHHNVTNWNASTEVWICDVQIQLAANTVITAALESAVNDAGIASWEFSVEEGQRLGSGATPIGNETNAANGFGSVAFTSLSSIERLYVRAMTKQANATTAITASADFTTWALANRSRNNALAVMPRAEHRIVTGTGSGASNPTLANTGNTGNVFVALVEEDAPTPRLLTTASTSTATATAELAVELTLLVEWLEGTTVRATRTVFPGVAWDTSTLTLTTEERDAVGAWTNPRVRVTGPTGVSVALLGATGVVEATTSDVELSTAATTTATATAALTTTARLLTAATSTSDVTAALTTTVRLQMLAETVSDSTANVTVPVLAVVVPNSLIAAGEWAPSTGDDLVAVVGDATDTTFIRSSEGDALDPVTFGFPAMARTGPMAVVVRHRLGA
jgi:hypothetical protein